MTFLYEFQREDLKYWYRYSYKETQRLHGSRSRFITAWSSLFLGIAIAVSLVIQSWPAAIVSFGFALFLALSTGNWYDSQAEKHVQRLSGDPRFKANFGARQLILSEAGLRDVSPLMDSLAKWEAVRDPVFHGEHIIIPLASGSAAVISRSSFSGPVPFEELPKEILEFRQKYGTHQPST